MEYVRQYALDEHRRHLELELAGKYVMWDVQVPPPRRLRLRPWV